MRAAPGRAARSRWGCAGGRTLARSPCLDTPARVFIANIASPGIHGGRRVWPPGRCPLVSALSAPSDRPPDDPSLALQARRDPLRTHHAFRFAPRSGAGPARSAAPGSEPPCAHPLVPPDHHVAINSLSRTLLPRGYTGVGVCGLRAGAPSSRRSALPRIVHRTILRSLFRRDGTRFAPITPSDSRLARGQGRPGRPPRGLSRRAPTLSFPPTTTPHWIPYCEHCFPGDARGSACVASGPVPPRLGAQRSLGSSTGRSFARSSGATGPASHPSRLQIRASLGGRAGPVGRPGVRAAVRPPSRSPRPPHRIGFPIANIASPGTHGGRRVRPPGRCPLVSALSAPSDRPPDDPSLALQARRDPLRTHHAFRFAPRSGAGPARSAAPGSEPPCAHPLVPPDHHTALDSLLRTLLPRGRTGVGGVAPAGPRP